MVLSSANLLNIEQSRKIKLMIHLPKPRLSGRIKAPVKALVPCLTSYSVKQYSSSKQKLKTISPSLCQNASNYYIDLLYELKVLSTLKSK